MKIFIVIMATMAWILLFFHVFLVSTPAIDPYFTRYGYDCTGDLTRFRFAFYMMTVLFSMVAAVSSLATFLIRGRKEIPYTLLAYSNGPILTISALLYFNLRKGGM